MTADFRAESERHARELAAVPSAIGRSCWSDSQNLWIRIQEPTQFSSEDVVNLADRGFFVDVNPLDGPPFALDRFAELSRFEGIRLSSESTDDYSGIEVLGELQNVRVLSIRFVVDTGIDFSGLTGLESFDCPGHAAVTAFGLPRLEVLGFRLPMIPDEVCVTAPVQILSFAVDTLLNLDFITSASLVSLGVECPRFDLQWLDRFTQLRMLELGPVSDVSVPASSKVLNLPVDIELVNVKSVVGAENFAGLPADGYLNVKQNHAFPKETQRLFRGRDWYFAPYSAARGPAESNSRESSDGVSFYPFIVSSDDGQHVVCFDNWDLIEALLDIAAVSSVNEVVQNAMVEQARELRIQGTNDSDSDSARLEFANREDAERAADSLRELWFRDADHASFIQRGIKSRI